MQSTQKRHVRSESHRPQRASGTTECAILTAIEGTLLDLTTFDCRGARAAVQRLRAARIPVIPVTVMTLDEMEVIADELGIRDPMIIEAGGAIARWKNGWKIEPLGTPADTLLDAICTIEGLTGADLLVYSILPEQQASTFSGRSGAGLRASLRRRFSEPFLIEGGSLAEVTAAAASLGYTVHRGRNFFYLARPSTYNTAMDRIREELPCDTIVGVGGSPIDADFLARADVAVIVPGPDGRADSELVAKVPQAVVAPFAGIEGWAGAIADVRTAMALSADSPTSVGDLARI